MNAGRLEQVGAPAEIYRTPRTAYVADFIGAANILTAELAAPATAGATVRLTLGGRHVGAVCPQSLPAGSVRVVVRPEDIALAPATGAGDDTLAARVIRRHYLGAKTGYAAALDDGTRITIDVAGPDHDRFAVGDMVAVRIDPSRALAIAP
jgi:iron(III) transport system ATP-binding protein